MSMRRLQQNSARMREWISLRRGGYSLVEMIIYVSLLILIVSVAVASIVAMVRSQRNIKYLVVIQESAVVSLDKMVREIRDAYSIDPTSTLGTSPGRLILNTADSSGNARVVEFYLDSGRLMMKEDGVVVGPLTLSSATVSNLIFRNIDTSVSDAIKISMTISSGTGASAQSDNFYTTTVLRSSY